MLISMEGTGPLYRRIYSSIRESILMERLAAGTRLPASREMARELGVSRNVVLLAYENLIAEGYATGHVGAGTYVAAVMPESRPALSSRRPKSVERTGPLRLSEFALRICAIQNPVTRHPAQLPYDFEYGVSNPNDFPHRIWRSLISRDPRLSHFRYEPPEGNASLRSEIAAYLRRSRAVVCEPDQILVVNGSQQALDLCARTLINAGDVVAMEEPGYFGAKDVFTGAGARVVPVPVDTSGLLTEKLPKAARRPRLAYVTPSHQFPTGAILPLARRLALLSWAASTGAFIIEDDYDGEYRYDDRPLESMQGLDRNGQVLYVGSLSNVMFPALRLGYIVVPHRLQHAFRSVKWHSDRHAPILQQEALANFMKEGHFERHLRRTRARNARRRGALLSAVEKYCPDSLRIFGASAGIHVYGWLPAVDPLDLETWIARAANMGVGVYSSAPFYTSPARRAEILLGYGALEEQRITEGIRRLGDLC